MSTSEDEAVEGLRERVDQVERRMDRIENAVSSGGSEDEGAEEEIEDLRISLNGLRREHRELKSEVEDKVLDYIEEEKEVLEEMDRKVETVGDLAREIKSNSDELRELQEGLKELEREKVDMEAFEGRLEDLEAESSSEDRDILERVKKLETRMDLIAERID